MEKRSLCIAAAAYVCGIVCAEGGITCLVPLLWIVQLLLLFVYKKKKIRRKLWLLLPLLIYLGASRTESLRQRMLVEDIQSGQEILLSGKVYRTETKNDKYIVYLKNLQILSYQSEKINSNFQHQLSDSCCIVYMQKKEELKIGNYIAVQGICRLFSKASNKGQFDSVMYYKGQNISFTVQKAEIVSMNKEFDKVLQTLLEWRGCLHGQFAEITDQQKASLLQAMLLGEKNEVDKETMKLYQDNGISHILVISGWHYSMIGICIYGMLKRLGASFKVSGGISLFILFMFGLATGFAVSAVRAFIMFSIATGARILGRTYDMPTALSLALLYVLWDNPYCLFQCDFLLSFGAVMGLILILPVFEQLLGIKNRFLGTFFATLSIQIITLPIMLYFFFETPVYAILVNCIVLPFVTMLTLIAFAALGVSFFSVSLAKIIIFPASLILDFYEKSCSIAAKLPFSKYVAGQPDMIHILLYYLGIIIWVSVFYYLQAKKGNKKQEEKSRKDKVKYLVYKVCFTGCLGIFMLQLIWRSDIGLTITMLDVGQGESIYIKTDNGTVMLFDGGSSDISKAGIYRIAPFLKSEGNDTVDYVFLSHLDSDHISGIQEIIQEKSIQIRTVFLPDTCLRDESFQKMQRLAEENGIAVRYFGKGSILQDGEMTITGLHPEPDYQTDSKNDTSIVMLLKYKYFSMLFTGDIEEGAEQKLLKEQAVNDIDVLQVAHHGSKYSSCEVLLDQIKPEYAWISCGIENSYGHPHQELLNRLEKRKCKIYVTANTGQIQLKTDGNSMKVISYFDRIGYNEQ